MAPLTLPGSEGTRLRCRVRARAGGGAGELPGGGLLRDLAEGVAEAEGGGGSLAWQSETRYRARGCHLQAP